LRIIAGKYRSRKIIAPPGAETRPTLDRIRESLFNILGQRCSDAKVLDLFAGSGALGFEAISRGAKQTVFCDVSRAAVLAIRANIDSLGVTSSVRLLQKDWQAALRQLSDERVKFDIIFLDPPYKMAAVPSVEAIADSFLLEDKALIVLEHDRRAQIELSERFMILDQRHYGDTDILFVAQTKDYRIRGLDHGQ
jgi:16S rRNA (guanine966-N2)-methyltransferase